jgi:hypothetical protein
MSCLETFGKILWIFAPACAGDAPLALEKILVFSRPCASRAQVFGWFDP